MPDIIPWARVLRQPVSWYADGSGLTAEGRARRETARLRAAEMFAQDADPVQIAQIDCLSQG
jgi:hypothetical protein